MVDDEQNVLDGLRNLLRSKRREWDMSFACGPEAALAMLATTTFDVVVTDMRMPKMDGAALLTRVRAMQPHAVRIVLSGQTQAESAMKSVFVAHRFLAKPCQPEVLQNAVDRACGLNAILEDPALRAAVGDISTLPPVPGIYLKLCQVMTQPNASIKDIVPIVEGDVGLCAKIMQMVNSAFFGLPRKICSLHEAVNYLGMVTIKNLAMAVEAFKVGAWPLGATSAAAVQRHSLLTAQVARHIFGSDKGRADDAFLSGILHDVGRLMNVATPADGEKTDHALLGAYLLGLWGLPQTIIEAVMYHNAPACLDHSTFDVVDAVHVADRLVARLGGCDAAPLDESHLAAMGVTPAKMMEWETYARSLVEAPQRKAA
ncbi:MAG: hypothetical protein QOI66_369 [Myxococcales bacterium]|jgi:HD-like signal output (HDOD) protein/CheY-like chemotaxis protein|nr:hypothetical protein [Myxococcales bacterium]